MPRLRLRNKLLLFSLLLALIPIGVAGRTLIRITQDELKTFTNAEVVLTAEQIAGEIDTRLGDGWAPALLMLRDALESPDLGSAEAMAVLRSSREIPDLVALQVRGGALAAPLVVVEGGFEERLQAAGLDAASATAPSEAMLRALPEAGPDPVTESAHVAETDDWLLKLAVPLRSEWLGASASLAVCLDLARLRERIESHRFGRTGAVFVVDAEGRRLFDPQRTDLAALDPIVAARQFVGTGASAAGAMPYVRPDGEAMLGGYAVSQRLPWIVVVERSEARAYTAIRAMTRSLTLWVGVGFVVAVAGAFVFARRISGPILEIERVARDVGQGNFDVRVSRIASGDEIAALATQINDMVEGLIERERVKGENVLLVELTEKLKALNEQKNRFLGMAAHDLRNPIGGILGYAEMLLEEEDLSEEDRTVVSKIEASSKFMLRLLNDLLDLSQIESGRLNLELADVDLGALVRENVELNRIIAGKKDIRIELESEDVPPVHADAGKLEQVLSNLISNAVKFSNRGSTVTVSLERGEAEAVVRVRDQGQGIPADEIQHLFQEFRRTSVASTGGEKSTGLGLAIVKKIVEGHGGRIGVESQVGTGSVFHVSLPLAGSPAGGSGGRLSDRVEARVPLYFSVESQEGASQAGSGTAVDLSASGSLVESSVPLRVGDTLRFTLRLPEGSVTGRGELVRKVGASRFGLSFMELDSGGADALARFVAATSGGDA